MNNDELQVLGTENRKSNNRKWIIAAVCVVLSIVCYIIYNRCSSTDHSLPMSQEGSTISPALQHAADSLLNDKLTEINGLQGQVIIMNVQTGEILAMAGRERNFEGKFQPCQNFAYQQELGSLMKTASLLIALETGKAKLDDVVDTGNGVWEIDEDRIFKDHNWRRGGYGETTFEKALLMKSRIGMYKAFTTMPNGTDLWRQACDTTAKSNAIELAMTFNQKYHPKSSLGYVKKIATGIFEKKGIQHRLAPEGVKLAGMYNIRQSDDNKRTSDEFTFVGCFPADNPKYTIGMVVIRPHKLPANIGMLSKEVNQLIEWLMNRNK